MVVEVQGKGKILQYSLLLKPVWRSSTWLPPVDVIKRIFGYLWWDHRNKLFNLIFGRGGVGVRWLTGEDPTGDDTRIELSVLLVLGLVMMSFTPLPNSNSIQNGWRRTSPYFFLSFFLSFFLHFILIRKISVLYIPGLLWLLRPL